MKPLAIFRLGQTHDDIAAALGDFDPWIIDGLGRRDLSVTVIDPRQGDELPAPHELAGVVMTGSHSMVTDREDWSERTAAWLRTAVAANLPVLGICYGHQLLAHALGGEVDYHPGGIELGTIPVELLPAAQDDALFADMPPRFGGQSAHRQSVRQLPTGAVVLAGNSFEPHQAVRYAHNAWGVQFHPEFSAAATQAYVRAVGPTTPPPVDHTPVAASVLPRFARIVSGTTR